MRNIVNANEFLKAMNKVNKATTKKSGLAILEEIKVDFTENKCTLTATNLNQFIVSEIEANGNTFSFVFKNTKDILKASKYFDNDLVFDFEDNIITLNSNKKSCKQTTFLADDFPATPEIEFENIYSMNVTNLNDRYNKIKYATSKDELNLILSGVCFSENKMIALDGVRVAINTDDSLKVNNEFIVPQEALKLLSIYDKNVNIEMQVNHKFLTITDGITKVVTRLIEKEYLKTDQLIPADSTEVYNIQIKQYEKELKYLNEFAKDIKNHEVKFENGKLTCEGLNGKYTANVDFGIDSNIVYGFNCSYMLDALSQFKEYKNAEYKLKSHVTPITIVSGNDLALVFPIRIAL